MATINAVSQAVSTLTKQPKVVNGGQRIKKQGLPTQVTWESAEKTTIAAVGAEGNAHNKWTSATDQLWILGVRPTDLEPVLDAKGKKVQSEVSKRIEGIVVKGFSARAQSLLSVSGTGLSGLSEAERGERRYWTKRIPVMMSRIAAYLRKHEDNERGVSTKKTLSERIDDLCKQWIKKIQDAPAEKIDGFDDKKVIELFQDIRKEVI